MWGRITRLLEKQKNVRTFQEENAENRIALPEHFKYYIEKQTNKQTNKQSL